MNVARRTLTGLVISLTVVLMGCDIQTATAPKGKVSLYAEFDDVQDLTRGHYVELSNVVVGSVESLELDGYRARVTLSIVDGRNIPVGTQAIVRRTSLLGEHFVDLVPPDRFDPVNGPFMHDGDQITKTSTQLDVEDLAKQAAVVVGAISGDDISSTLTAGSQALSGRGATLNQAIAQSANVLATLHDQQGALLSTIDSLSTLGIAVAPHSDQVAALIDQLAQATSVVSANRDRIVASIQSLVALADATNQNVLIPETDRIIALLSQLHPVLSDLADGNASIVNLFANVETFNQRLPTVVGNGQVLLQAWLDPTLAVGPGGLPDVTDPVKLLTDLLNRTL